MHGHLGKYAEAEVLELEVLEASRRVHGAGHPDTLRAAANIMEMHGHLGKHAEAEVLTSTRTRSSLPATSHTRTTIRAGSPRPRGSWSGCWRRLGG